MDEWGKIEYWKEGGLLSVNTLIKSYLMNKLVHLYLIVDHIFRRYFLDGEEIAGNVLGKVPPIHAGPVKQLVDKYHGSRVHMVETDQELATTVTSL